MPVAVVTGAGSGIGRATAERFGRKGWTIVVSDINEATGAETVDRIPEQAATPFSVAWTSPTWKTGGNSPTGCARNTALPICWSTTPGSSSPVDSWSRRVPIGVA
ncbi:Putative oxidoreductase EphD [Mycobacteroides abscessus]|nr:Putative oxidoreductase EphD [Mycobacteroides abscessus]